MIHIIRILFLVVVLALTVSYAYQEEIRRPGPNYVTVFILIPALIGAALVLIDMFWHRKRLHVLSGLFFGVLTGLFFAYILSLIVTLVVSLFSLPGPVTVPPEPISVSRPAIVSAGPPEREAGMTDTQFAQRKLEYEQAVKEYRREDEQVRQAQLRYQNAKDRQDDYLAYAKTIQLIKMLLGASAVFLCVTIVMQTKDDFRFVIPYMQFSREAKGARPLLLDTSVIIDGRIADIAETRILESEVIVPRFVLAELQSIADSSDKLRRNRGRRGLDVLNRLQGNDDLDIEILDPHVPSVETVADVDNKLVALAKHLNGRVVTNDYNLNKVAKLRGVDVININDLANALKPVVLPGESMSLRVLKPGEESGQGVGYLDDGTMVVVEQGRDFMGRQVQITVTSVLQTSAGRMIFGRLDADKTLSARTGNNDDTTKS